MEKFVIVVHLMIVLAMIGFVLLQKSEGGGFAAGSTPGFLLRRRPAHLLTRDARLPGGCVLCDEPPAVDPGRVPSQSDDHPAADDEHARRAVAVRCPRDPAGRAGRWHPGPTPAARAGAPPAIRPASAATVKD